MGLRYTTQKKVLWKNISHYMAGSHDNWQCCVLYVEYGAISMGQGQEVHARRLVQQSMQDGSWVLLHNCHLGLDYMDELLDTIIGGESIQSSFRLWLTTEVHPQFPINFLQVSAALFTPCTSTSSDGR